MTPEEKALVKDSWSKVAPIADTAAELFYGRLFTIAPQVKPLFKSDMKSQGKKLMQTLGFAVASLDNLDALIPALQNLAKRHVDYGVADEHYAPVGDALLWTLEQGLGSDFTPETKAAWTTVYATISSVMIEATKSCA